MPRCLTRHNQGESLCYGANTVCLLYRASKPTKLLGHVTVAVPQDPDQQQEGISSYGSSCCGYSLCYGENSYNLFVVGWFGPRGTASELRHSNLQTFWILSMAGWVLWYSYGAPIYKQSESSP